MHHNDNLPGYPWVWRRATDSADPLNTGIRASVMPGKRGPKAKAGIGHNNGTMHGLTKRADALLQPRPALPGHMSSATQVTPMHAPSASSHSGTYSRAGVKGGDGKIHKARKAAPARVVAS